MSLPPAVAGRLGARWKDRGWPPRRRIFAEDDLGLSRQRRARWIDRAERRIRKGVADRRSSRAPLVAFPRSLISDILLTERRLRLPYATGCSFKMPENTPRKKPFNSDTAEAKFSPEVSSSKERLYETLALLRTELIRAIKRLNSLFKGYRWRRSAGYGSRRLISSTCASGFAETVIIARLVTRSLLRSSADD